MRLTWNTRHGTTNGHDFCANLKALGYDLAVFVDGVRQHKFTFVDTDRGEVGRFVLTPDGRVQHDPRNRGEAWHETVTGKVQVEIEKTGATRG